jgi:hypothetical protein
MMSTEPELLQRNENFSLTQTAAGVLTVRLHTRNRARVRIARCP